MKNRNLLLAVGGLAAAAWAMRRPPAADDGSTRAEPSVATDSPNAAERLQAAGVVGGSDSPGADLLSPGAGPDARGPGLNDFFRGA